MPKIRASGRAQSWASSRKRRPSTATFWRSSVKRTRRKRKNDRKAPRLALLHKTRLAICKVSPRAATIMIQPMCKYITDHGGKIEFDTTVTNVVCDCKPERKVAKKIEYTQGGKKKTIDLTENDLVFITNGAQGDCSVYGDQNTAPVVTIKNGESPSCQMWTAIAKQDPAFGHPEKFFKDIKETSWESWTVDTANKQILDRIQEICKRDPLSGNVVTGGIITCKGSSWLVSWTINRQGQFQEQPKDHCLIWVYGLNCWDDKGDFVKKNMCDCTGAELCEEFLYHIGIPDGDIERLATKECNTTPCMGIGPAVAIPKVLKYTGLKMEDIDLWELNEAFSSQAIACIKELHMYGNGPAVLLTVVFPILG